MGDAELFAGIEPALLAPQPLAVQEVGVGQVGSHRGAFEQRDRFPKVRLGLLVVGEQGS
jgi:hypothetical protein